MIRIWLAMKVKWLRPYLLTHIEQEKLSILELKACFKSFGFDISDMSDNEIKKGINETSKIINQTGLSAQEFVDFSKRLCLISSKSN